MTSKKELTQKIAELEEAYGKLDTELFQAKQTVNRLMEKLVDREARVKALSLENETLVHTPEFAADTESAYNRGSAQAARSVAYNNILHSLDIVRELRVVLDEQEQKYRRETAYDMFTGAQPTEQEDQALPQTDFTAKLLQDALDKRD